MRIFLTGATGYIGSAVLDVFARAGHDVRCLARGPEKCAEVERRGGRPVSGDLSQPRSYLDAATDCDGFVHAGFEGTARRVEVDRSAIDTVLEAARRRTSASGRRPVVIYTSGIWVLGNTHEPAAEDARLDPTAAVTWRPAHEQLVLDASTDGIRSVVVRPGIVSGGRSGIIGDLIRDAENGLIRIVGNGENHWPVVYRRDLADLYLRLVESDDAAGVFHANDEADERVIDIVGAIAVQAKTPPDIRRMPIDEAVSKMGPYALALALDQRVRSPRARALGWTPTLRSVVANAPRLVEEWRR